MPSHGRAETLRSLFTAFMENDRATAEALLADDFTFTSPYDDAIDKATYFERCWPNSDLFESQIIETICADGDEAFLLYRCVTRDGRAFRNAEFFTFAGDRIASINVFFGATYRDGVLVQQT